MEEPSKIFVYFFYNLHHLFHVQVPEISLLNSWFFPHAHDPLLQKILSELAERRLDAGIGEYVELHMPVRGVAVAAYHVVEVLTGVEGLGHALSHWPNAWVWWCMPSCPGFPATTHATSIFFLWKHTNHVFSSLCIYFFSPSQF